MTNPKAAPKPPIHLTPTEAAIHDLVTLTLHQQDARQVTDRPSGKAVAKLCELAGIPHSRNLQGHVLNTLRKMEENGQVRRDVNVKRTFMIELIMPLSAEQERQLAHRATRNRDTLSTDKASEIEVAPEYERLVKLCRRVYAAIQSEAKVAAKKDNGHVALNVTGITKALGIRRDPANEARHYLKKQGLIKAIMKTDGNDTLLWWWKVSEQPLDIGRLIEHATNPDTSYESSKLQRSAGHEDTSRERNYAGAAPAVLPDALCGPVTISRVADQKREVPTPVPPKASTPKDMIARVAAAAGNKPKATPTPATPPPAGDDRMQRLIAIIKRLEAEKAALQQELATFKAESGDEIDELRETVKLLEAKAETRTAAMTEADKLIERYGK